MSAHPFFPIHTLQHKTNLSKFLLFYPVSIRTMIDFSMSLNGKKGFFNLSAFFFCLISLIFWFFQSKRNRAQRISDGRLKAPFVLTDTSVLPPVCSSPSPHLFAHSKHLNHSMCLEHLERMGHLKKTTVFLPKHFPSLRVARQCFFLSARLIALRPALCSRTLS